ncbi:glucosamine 6-phosphate N-acetyltransferase-like isoform X2 [Ostrea edulis]|nr:glucosamine 6-phosphate N-acetyltransferase-like isoform X2 [Ostrea edulis]XP_048731149.1 glucosamine 6-phosphate N-acetyltransferase-like isoform X2 [Ostrea edulis]
MAIVNRNAMADTPIYSPELLEEIDFEKEHLATYDPPISLTNPGPNLKLRPLQLSDYNKGYMDLLLSALYMQDSAVTQQEFKERWDKMKASGGSYYITVIEDTSTQKIIGNAVLHVEYKLLQSSFRRGRIEDIAVLEGYRLKQLAKLLIDVTTILCKKVGCFRVSLYCKDRVIPLYQKFGFYIDKAENLMWLDKMKLQ